MDKQKIFSSLFLKSLFNLTCIFSLLLFYLASAGQDPNRFKEQVDQLKAAEPHFPHHKKTVVFAGSSSIRMWKDVQERFPEFNVINNGFGGSHFTDLIYYYDDLVKRFNPDVLFIYEGDNDVAHEKRPGKIKRDAKKLHKMIRKDLPKTKIIFISPKPSVKRWNLKKQYEKVNRKLKRFSGRKDNTEFADVWNAMLDENGMVLQDVFLKDDLHMNKKGYDIWEEVLEDYLY